MVGAAFDGRALAAGLAVALALLDGAALAQPAPPPPAQKSAAENRKKEEAREHFQRGISLFDEESWDAALAEFDLARSLYPGRASTKNAALCLRLLKRYDEALDTFEELLAFPNLTREDQELAEREVVALRKRVGNVTITGAADGMLSVDGRTRGTAPAKPLRLSVGTHVIRVVKEGYEPFETKIEVAGGVSKSVEVQMVRLGEHPVILVARTPPPPPEKQRDLLTPAAITLTLGGLALGTGAVLGGVTLSKASAIKAHCVDDVCPHDQLTASQSARTTAAISTTGFALGGALAATGLTLLVIHYRSKAPKPPAAGLGLPSFAIGPGSLLIEETF